MDIQVSGLKTHSAPLACPDLFAAQKLDRPSSPIQSRLIDETWRDVLEHDYSSLLRELGAVGEPLPEFGVGKLMHQHWKAHPAVNAPMLKIGFKVVDGPGEVPRFVFPETAMDLIKNIELAQGPNPTFKLATHSQDQWTPLDQPLVMGTKVGASVDADFMSFARMTAAGYTPLWPTGKSLLTLHDLAHIGERVEFPEVSLALTAFFKTYLEKNLQSDTAYRERAEIFNEASYVLKKEKYAAIDGLLVSGLSKLDGTNSVETRAKRIVEALESNSDGTLVRVKALTSSFDDLFHRHGGGARDFFNIESVFLTVETVGHYSNVMARNPADGMYFDALTPEARIEALESLEGINRQIQYATGKSLREPGNEKNLWFLAYRLAQLETAMLVQRDLGLTQVDIINDSLLPPGASSKTRTYFEAFQPWGSRHYTSFVAGRYRNE